MSDQEFVYAQKNMGGKTQTRKFTKLAWDLMGKDKNGWKEVPSEAQKGNAKKAVVPPQAENTANVAGNADAPEEAKKPKTAAELRKELEEAEAREANENKGPEDNGVNTDDNGGNTSSEAGTKGPKSTDGNVVDAIAYMKTLKTKEEIEAYAAGDDRTTVIKGRDKIIAELG